MEQRPEIIEGQILYRVMALEAEKRGIIMKKSLGLMVIAFLLFFFTNRAYAYLDPGTGSMLLQGLIAGIMVVAGAIGIYWRRLKDFLARFNKRRDNNGDSHES